MPNSVLNIGDKITFKTVALSPGDTYEISATSIITCVFGDVFDRVKGVLKTFESSAYYCGTLEARMSSFLTIIELKDENILLNKIDVEKEFGTFCRDNWKSLFDLTGNEEHKKVDLYRSDQEEHEFMGTKYKFNFWFCGKEVDCLFHNNHDFIEIHTGVAGDGYMQKSIDGTDKTLVETVGLLPGTSHRIFAIEGEFEENGNPKYPFHRRLGGTTGNIWLVVERY